jgi:hypothetical protein
MFVTKEMKKPSWQRSAGDGRQYNRFPQSQNHHGPLTGHIKFLYILFFTYFSHKIIDSMRCFLCSFHRLLSKESLETTQSTEK